LFVDRSKKIQDERHQYRNENRVDQLRHHAIRLWNKRVNESLDRLIPRKRGDQSKRRGYNTKDSLGAGHDDSVAGTKNWPSP